MGKVVSKLENKRTYQQNFGWWEVKMGTLLIFILLMLIIGTQLKNIREIATVTEKPKPIFWRLTKAETLEEKLGVTFKEPWQMTEADLTLSRVIYNLLTKTGFRWLSLEVLAGMIVSWMFIRGVSWVVAWQWRQWSKMAVAASKVATATVRIQIAGTVEIVAKNGLIYASAVAEGNGESQDTYAFYLATVKISIVPA